MQDQNPLPISSIDPVDGRSISAALAHRDMRGGLSGLIAVWLLSWHERRHAARVSDELLALYRNVAANHPDLATRELYQLVVMQRTGCNSGTADGILDCAEESFAEWPARRELTLCDVVHYLSVTEFLATHKGENWIHANMALVVTSHIPNSL